MHAVVKGGKTARASALVQQGLQLILQGRYEDALAAEEAALGLAPALPDAHSYRGSALLQLGRIDEALASYEKVVKLAPNAAVAHYNRANALQRLRRYNEALQSLKRALKLQPNYTDALSLTGNVLLALGDIQAALQYYDAALKINPNAADAHFNKGLALLTIGEFCNSWDHYDWRLRWDMAIRVGQSRSIERVARDWDGQSTDNPILVIPEHGLGDQIFYGGMLADLQRIAPGSTVCLEPRLVSLFARSFVNLHFVSPDAIDTEQCVKRGSFGAQIHMGSLGRFFRSSTIGLHNISSGYLKSDSVKTAELRNRIAKKERLICGISWRSKNADIGAEKSITLDRLTPLLLAPGVDFIDLQYGDTSDERRAFEQTNGICIRRLDDIDNKNDIDSLAALISACDIVITISNVTAHIAAAIGKPTLVMLPNSSSLFWYWHRDRTDSPWYPTAVLLRQTLRGEWKDVIGIARAALDEFRSEHFG